MSKASRPPSPSPSLSPPQADSVKQVAISTTFVQAEKESFREVVQRYTGASDDAEGKLPVTSKIAGASNGGRIGSEALPRGPMYKLHERRQKSGKEMKLEIKQSPFLFKRNGASPRTTEAPSLSLSPSPSPTLQYDHLLPPLLSSPVTPLSALSLNSSSSPTASPIMDQTPPLSSTFFMYQRQAEPCSLFSPVMQQRKTQPQPQLLNLFPLTSPRMT